MSELREQKDVANLTDIDKFTIKFKDIAKMNDPESAITIDLLTELLTTLSKEHPELVEFNSDPKSEKKFDTNSSGNNPYFFEIKGYEKDHPYLVKFEVKENIFPGTLIHFITLGRPEGIMGSRILNILGRKLDAEQIEIFNNFLSESIKKVTTKKFNLSVD